MQLNNKTTGDSIKLQAIDLQKNTAIFTTVDCAGEVTGSIRFQFSNITLADHIHQSTDFSELACSQFKQEAVRLVETPSSVEVEVSEGVFETTTVIEQLPVEVYADYVLEDDTQNWMSDTKTMRFFIPLPLIVEALKEKLETGESAFHDVIANMIEAKSSDPSIIILYHEKFTIIYASSINDANKLVIEPLLEAGTIKFEQQNILN